MDPVASGLTILSTIRKAVQTAKELYEAPRELEELQAETDTFAIVLNNVVADACDLRNANDGIRLAVKGAQACLLEIQELIEYKLIKDAPEGKKARRTAWLRHVQVVHGLLERLSERRANVVLALGCETAVSAKRAEAALHSMQHVLQTRHCDIERFFSQHDTDSRSRHGAMMKRLDLQEQQLESRWAHLLEAQREQSLLLENRLSELFDEVLHIQCPDRDPPKGLPHGSSARLLEPCHVPELLPAPTYDAGLAASENNDLSIERLPYSQLGGWVSYCRTHHHACLASDPCPLPTRVLDVGHEGDEVYLYEPKEWETGEYVVLSYIWGGKARIVTDTGSLASRLTGIPWDALPPLFQDAIRLTRNLSIRYLWIDVLCIIQDDAIDWLEQCYCMGTVFENATLMITSHSNCNPASKIQLPASDAGSNVLGPLARVENTRALAKQLLDVGQSQWTSRAWLFQERMLAKRILHVSNRAVLWECNHAIARVATSSEAQSEVMVRQSGNDLKYMSSVASLMSASRQTVQAIWWKIVEQYSALSLTHQSDKLTALAGVARRFEAELGTYAAGLWLTQDFIWSLSWRPRSGLCRSRVYSGPTWSWASLTTSVLAPMPSTVLDPAVIVSIGAGELHVSGHGPVDRAHLTLHGRFVPVEVQGCDAENEEGQLFVRVRKGGLFATFASDAYQPFSPGNILIFLKLFEDQEGNITCIVLACPTSCMRHDDQHLRQRREDLELKLKWRKTSTGEGLIWGRMGIITLYKQRGERRWFDGAQAEEFYIM